MAEQLFKDMLKKQGNQSAYEVSSAGINAIPHQYASDNSIEVMKEKGIDLDSHRSTMLTINLIEAQDLVLTMTQSHKDAILSSVPHLRDRVYTLKEYAGLTGDICDPFGGSIETYSRALEDIEHSIIKLIKKLEEEQ